MHLYGLTPLSEQGDYFSIKQAYQQKQYQKAIELSNNYLKLYKKDTDVLFFQGYSYYQLHDYKNASEAFEKLLAISNKYPEAWYALGQSYINLNDYPKALNVVNKGLAQNPADKNLLVLEHRLAILMKTNVKTTKPSQIAKTPSSTQHIPTEQTILQQYKKMQYQQAENDAQIYLSHYPQDTDMQYLLGLIYLKQNKQQKAEQQFKIALTHSPTNKTYRIALINVLFLQHKYQDVITISNQGLQTNTNTEDWQYEKAKAYYQLQDYRNAVISLQQIKKLSEYPDAKKLFDDINDETQFRYVAHNEFGIFDSHMSVKNPNEPWNIVSLYGFRKNEYGSFGGFVNYQYRPEHTGYQWGLAATPLLTNSTYLDLSYAYSDQPNLFANDDIYAEAYQYLPKGFQISLGDDYRKITSSYLNAYTGSIASVITNYEFRLRPIHYVPNQGPQSTMYKLTARRFGENPDQYLGLVYATGQSPDLDNLQTINFFKINDDIYMFEGQQPFNSKFLMQYGLGYEHQVFPNGKVRRFYYVNLGAKFRGI